jgi:predicted ATPase
MDLPIDASDSEAGDEAGRSPTLDYEVEMTSARSENLFAPLHLRAECLRRVGAEGDDLVFDLPPQGAATIAGANGTRVEQEVERTEAVLSQLARAHVGSTPDVQPALDACRSAGAALRGMRFLDLDPRALRQRSPVGRTTLGDRGQNLASVLMDVCEDEDRKAEVVDWAAALTPMDVADLTFTVAEYSSEVTLVLVEANGMETPMQSASDGTLRFLGLLALLFQDDPPGLLFVEDVDTGLHAERLDLLADLLEARTREAGVQVVATTHSPHLLRALSDDARADARRIHRPGPGPAATIEPAGEGLDDWGTGGLGD